MSSGRLLWPLLALQLLIYVDRGVLSGCSHELDQFIRKSLRTQRPDMYLGILQSAFIIGLSTACPIVARLAAWRPVPQLIAGGMLVWVLGELGTFASAALNDSVADDGGGGYLALLLSRAMTGVGEAALLSLVPPLLLRITGARAGHWLGIFCSVIPIGVAVGFIYGSTAVQFVGWAGAYLILALLSVPLLLYIIHLSLREGAATAYMAVSPGEEDREDPEPALQQVTNVLKIPAFFYVCVAYAAYAATATSISTFGAAFMTDTQTASSEASAASSLGVTVGLAGVFGSLFGGSLLTEADRRGRPVMPAAWLRLAAGRRAAPAAASARAAPAPTAACAPPPQLQVLQPLSAASPGRLAAILEEEEEASERKTDDEEERDFSPSSSYSSDRGKLGNYLTTMVPVLSLAVGLFAALPWIPRQLPFLCVLGVALALLFSAQVAFNLCAMLAVRPADRPCAVAVMTLFLHVAGDVPAPLVVGLIKDRLAPHCVPDTTLVRLVRGTRTPSPECVAEATGVRLTEQLCGLWLLWALLGVHRARAFI